MKSAGKARNNGLYRHIRTSKEIIRNLLNDFKKNLKKVVKTCNKSSCSFGRYCVRRKHEGRWFSWQKTPVAAQAFQGSLTGFAR